MQEWEGWKKVKYEHELDLSFADEIASQPGGEKLSHCIQCGTCSGMCPLSGSMDYTPRQIIAMVRGGFKGEVLKCYTTWMCASCYACAVECPKDIKITDIMYALKQKAIEEGVYPKRFPIPVLAREFFEMVKQTGRNSEGQLILKLYAHTNPLGILSKAGMGIKMLQGGRFSLKTESIEKTEELKKLLTAVKAPEA